MFDKLIKLADILDQSGHSNAANDIDDIIKIAKKQKGKNVKKVLNKRVKGGDEEQFIYHIVEDLKKAKNREELRKLLKVKADELREQALIEQAERNALNRAIIEKEKQEWEEITAPEEALPPAPPKLL